MTTEPDYFMIETALRAAAQSPCRSKRGVALFDMRSGAFRGAGFNGPPNGCPGRETCAGTCGRRSVHAEVRALRNAEVYIASHHPPGPYDLIHVELAPDGGVVACAGPSCPGCAAQILDVGFVGGVWLYEEWPTRDGGWVYGIWHRYLAAEFYEVTMQGVRQSITESTT